MLRRRSATPQRVSSILNSRGTAELFDFFKLDDEVQRRIGRNPRMRHRSVSEPGRNLQFDHSSHTDELQALGPAGNDLGQGELGWLSTVVRAVELRAVVQPAFVMGNDTFDF